MRAAPEPDAEIVVAWIRLLVRNVELLIAWLVLWVVLHLSGIVFAGIFLGPGRGGPIWVLPKAVGAARKVSQPPPAWTQRRGLMLPLATPSDWDFLVALGLVLTLEVFLK